jgi:hypothetical protein
MPEIKSPISRSVTSTDKNFRTFEVHDESGHEAPEYSSSVVHETRSHTRDVSEVEADYRAARRAKVTGQSPLTEYGRERVEVLTGLGRKTKAVTVEGVTFLLRTLSGKEQRSCVAAANKVPTIEALFEGRKHQLAYAIIQVDGQDLDLVLGTNDFNAKLSFIEEMEENIIDHIYDKFSDLNAEVKKQFAPKSDKEVQEVVEDIKK